MDANSFLSGQSRRTKTERTDCLHNSITMPMHDAHVAMSFRKSMILVKMLADMGLDLHVSASYESLHQ